MSSKNSFFLKAITLLLLFVCISCDKKPEQVSDNNPNKEFTWKFDLKISDIPDFPVKGFINGKEINLQYINFEQWRGSGDNVLNFGDVKPKNNCGYVEQDNSFHLIHKGGEIKTGDLLKSSFDQNLDGYIAFSNTGNESANNTKSSEPWNCALVITGIEDKIVKGKIAICFKNDKKNWIAGTFEAIRCFN